MAPYAQPERARRRLLALASVIMAAVTGTFVAVAASPAQAAPLYTEILGQSQTIQWFAGTRFNEPNWQARIVQSSGYMHWAHSDMVIWSNTNGATQSDGNGGTWKLQRTTADGAALRSKSEIGRVIITIGKNPDEVSDTPYVITGTYYTNLKALIATIDVQYPNVQEVLLQPLATSPNGTSCTVAGEIVNTEANFPAITSAIDDILNDDTDGITSNDNPMPVGKSIYPRVQSCNMFSDSTGHLKPSNPDGRLYVANLVANYFS